MGKKKAVKSGGATIAVTEDAGPPAEKKVNKSALIRAYLADHAEAKPKEVVEALAKQGVTVTGNAVSMLKTNDKKKGKAPAMKPGRKPGAPATNGQPTGAAAAVQAAATLIKAAGGPTEAQAVLAALVGVMN